MGMSRLRGGSAETKKKKEEEENWRILQLTLKPTT